MKNNAMITAIDSAIIKGKDIHIDFSVAKEWSSMCLDISPLQADICDDYIIFYLDNGDITIDTLNVDYIKEDDCYVCSGEASVFYIYL